MFAWPSVLLAAAALGGVALTALHSFLLFHAIAELFSIVVAAGIFVIAWNARQHSEHPYLLFLGIASLFIAGVDLMHTLAYKGMGVFPGADANLPTQLWIGARYLHGVSLLLAALAIGRTLDARLVFAAYAAVTALLLLSIFSWRVFPVCYIEGVGLTPFKRASEYVISVIMVASGLLLRRRRAAFEPSVLLLLLGAVAATVASELSFTAYVGVYGPMNLVGHLLKILAFWLVYLGIIQTSFRRPYDILFRDLVNSQQELERASEELTRQQAQLEATLQQMPAGVFIAEVPSGRILYGNAELERQFGRRVAETETVEEFARWPRLHPDGRPYETSEAPVIRSFASGEVVTGEEVEIVRSDGTRRTVSVNAAPVRDRQGRTLAVVAVNLDITERKRAEEALRFLADASSALAASLDWEPTLRRATQLVLSRLADFCMIDVVTEEGGVERVVAAHADPSKQPLADVLKRHPPSLEQPRGVGEVIRTGQARLLKTIGGKALSAVAQDADHLEALRELRPTSGMVVPLIARGRALGAMTLMLSQPGRSYGEEDLALAEEVARRAAMAVDNAWLYREAQDANAAKDRFLAVLSHELRNPLSPILAGVEVLRSGLRADDRARRTLDIIERNARLQARLVSDLLDLARIRRGKIHLQRGPADLSAVAAAAVSAQQGEADKAGLTLSLTASPGLWVLGDADRLQQVVLNLVANAVKFTPAGGEIRVTAGPVSAGDASPRARVIVEDTGIGIDQALLGHLFDMFRQGEVSGHRQSGLGIGLSLVRSLVELHGGRVWAESSGPGQGSRFTVELPRIAAPPRAKEERPQARDRGPIRALVVEDNPDTLALLRDSLESRGYHVQAAASAEDALQALPSARPEVIVADIDLPGLDGYELMRRVRSTPGYSDTPAYAVTGFGRVEDVRRALEAGYSGHFVKPVDVGALDRQVRDALGL